MICKYVGGHVTYWIVDPFLENEECKWWLAGHFDGCKLVTILLHNMEQFWEVLTCNQMSMVEYRPEH